MMMMMGCNLERSLSTIQTIFHYQIIHYNRLTITFLYPSLLRLYFSDISVGLRDVRVVIPTAVKKGDNALLICNYDMEEDSLYSIKWYKGRREFFRYTPKEPESMKTFPVAGISVEVECNQL
jgi:hypothetical protein